MADSRTVGIRNALALDESGLEKTYWGPSEEEMDAAKGTRNKGRRADRCIAQISESANRTILKSYGARQREEVEEPRTKEVCTMCHKQGNGYYAA